ncbi:Ig-like domain-containing protein [Luteibaculum oceani]|uniref:T9SS type A sorting domain-containing protein n=1 Tax=Luteibaculum oceani TaxID=1294296 RepID=A0A5C6VL77_9FLAO|nr:Ig-like domain-containing protein [Luteibaculum oceani]TXC85126.1 T9SS type A sorting domain-containing protein [Luteibaculum oceani]
MRKLLFLLFLFGFSLINFSLKAQDTICPVVDTLPFTTDSTHFKIWNGESYEQFFVKGMNLGISVPGTSPGELAATTEDYYRWFTEIKDAGFNAIRIYTLHYPRFYHALDSFNTANKNNPLFVFVGIWLEEELEGYDLDLYTLTDTFDVNGRIAVDAVHGNANVPCPRIGKGCGEYTTDISQWVIGYIIGREVYWEEVVNANLRHPTNTSFVGQFLSVDSAQPATTWLAQRMDNVLKHEMNNYGTARPISFSSWPTLDPIDHPLFPGRTYLVEDTAFFDLTRIDHSRAPGGIFASFHAYPYYPPFIDEDPKYQGRQDHLGENPYLAYIEDMAAFHKGMPLLIAEFGTPTSWASASDSRSNMNHGGNSSNQVGNNAIRMFRNYQQANIAGGCYFAWIDEWFKRTWITDEVDFNVYSRQRWHNLMAAEQNFGLKEYVQANISFQSTQFFGVTAPIVSVENAASYAYFHTKLLLNDPIEAGDTLWVGIDTYDNAIGESILPNGVSSSNRMEFALELTSTSANLYVTKAYDIDGIFFGIDKEEIYKPGQLYRSIVSNGAEWVLMQWHNDELDVNAIQKIGELKINQPGEILNSISYANNNTEVEIRLPWTMINFTDPSQMEVLHDDTATRFVKETAVSDGVAFTFFYENQKLETTNRYSWQKWITTTFPYQEQFKEAYFLVKDSLITMVSNPTIGRCDYYQFEANKTTTVDASKGVLSNDFQLDGKVLRAQLGTQPARGSVSLNPDGSFVYIPEDSIKGNDQFTYFALGEGLPSREVSVYVNIVDTITGGEPPEPPEPPQPPEPPVEPPVEPPLVDLEAEIVALGPNPNEGVFRFESDVFVDKYEIRDSKGQLMKESFILDVKGTVDLSALDDGMYYFTVFAGEQIISKKILLRRESN